MRAHFASWVAVAATLTGVRVSGDTPAGPVTAQTLPLSSSVLATVANRQQLQLLVLWRGAPGWHLSGDHRQASYSGSGDVFAATVIYGGVTLRLSFNTRDAKVLLQDKTLSLPAGTNVL